MPKMHSPCKTICFIPYTVIIYILFCIHFSISIPVPAILSQFPICCSTNKFLFDSKSYYRQGPVTASGQLVFRIHLPVETIIRILAENFWNSLNALLNIFILPDNNPVIQGKFIKDGIKIKYETDNRKKN